MSFDDDLKGLTERVKKLLRVPTEAEKRQVIILSSFLEELKRPLYEIKNLLQAAQAVTVPHIPAQFRIYPITLNEGSEVKLSLNASVIEFVDIVFGDVNNFFSIRFNETEPYVRIAQNPGKEEYPRKFKGDIKEIWFLSGVQPGKPSITFNILAYRNLETELLEPFWVEDGNGSLTIDGTVTTLGPQATSVITGSATANAGVSTQLAANACKSVTVQAKRTNTSYVEVGGAGGRTIQLDPLMAVSLDIFNTNLVFFTPQVTGEGVNWIAIN